jgi:hypothetical protein
MIQVLDAKRPPLQGRGQRIARVIAAAIESDDLLAAFERVLLLQPFQEAQDQGDVAIVEEPNGSVDGVD